MHGLTMEDDATWYKLTIESWEEQQNYGTRILGIISLFNWQLVQVQIGIVKPWNFEI
jgi:hypothetical protein